MEHPQEDADENQNSDRDRDVNHQLFDEGEDLPAGVDAVAEDEVLQDLRDEIDDDEGGEDALALGIGGAGGFGDGG